MYQFNYVPFILFEGISKSILLNSILNFAILSVFNARNCSYLALIRDGASDQFLQPAKRLAPLAPNILNLAPHPTPNIQNFPTPM